MRCLQAIGFSRWSLLIRRAIPLLCRIWRIHPLPRTRSKPKSRGFKGAVFLQLDCPENRGSGLLLFFGGEQIKKTRRAARVPGLKRNFLPALVHLFSGPQPVWFHSVFEYGLSISGLSGLSKCIPNYRLSEWNGEQDMKEKEKWTGSGAFGYTQSTRSYRKQVVVNDVCSTAFAARANVSYGFGCLGGGL